MLFLFEKLRLRYNAANFPVYYLLSNLILRLRKAILFRKIPAGRY